jgi:hypothetical protein
MHSRNLWEPCRAVVAAMLTVCLAASAIAQPPSRISRSDRDFDSLNRLLLQGGTFNGRPPVSPGLSSQVDVSRVDLSTLSNLLQDAVDESSRLYRSLDADRVRSPQIRPLLSELLQMRARASGLWNDLRDRVALQSLVPAFQEMDSSWRLLSHRLGQTPQLGRDTMASIDRLDGIDRKIGKLFQMNPTVDRRALTLQLASLTNSYSNLIQELELDLNGGGQTLSLVMDAQTIQQQARRIEQFVLEQAPYEQIVTEYGRVSRKWTVLYEQLRRNDNRFVERAVRNISNADNSINQLLWLEQTADRTRLLQTATSLMRNVDEFYSRTPLKLLLGISDPQELMQTADSFYGTVENLKDVLDRNENEQQILESYQYVEEYGQDFSRVFSQLRSQAARVVLREIEDGIASLRSELNLSGTVNQVDTQQLLTAAASLDNLTELLDSEVRNWLDRDRQTFRNDALQASSAFAQRAQRLHRLLHGQPTPAELERETVALASEWERIYQYLGRCQTSNRANLARLAGEIRQAIYDLSAPLQL